MQFKYRGKTETIKEHLKTKTVLDKRLQEEDGVTVVTILRNKRNKVLASSLVLSESDR